MRKVRLDRGLTLRAVEGATGISNAYLSQLETGKIAKPSPNYLYKLAEFFALPYELLLEQAGYVTQSGGEQKRHRRLSGAALATIDDLTEEEEEALMDYLTYLRTVRRKSRGPQDSNG